MVSPPEICQVCPDSWGSTLKRGLAVLLLLEGMLALLYALIWMGRWIGWYVEVMQLRTLLGLALFAAAAAWMLQGVRQAARVSDEEGLRMAEQAVRQAAVSCYALEGAYPASYADLKQRSGVAVDEERYIIFYEIFASNIMPDVTVLERQVAP